MDLVTFMQIKEAAERIDGHILRTPLVRATQLDGFFNGAQIYIKPENLQPIGSFKIRGASNAVLSITSGKKPNGVVAVSSGNHAQGVAYAARKAGIKAVIVMPEIASALKADKTRAYGAEVIISGKNNNESEIKAQELVNKDGLVFIHSHRDPMVIAGQGTIGIEIIEDEPDMDIIICPIGGGGLISGIALATKTLNPKAVIYGVEPALVPRFAESQKAGKPLTLNPDKLTIADGTRTLTAPELNYNMIDAYVDELVSVEEVEIKEALKLMIFESKFVMEPSSAMVFAAALFEKIKLSPEQKVCFILSGGSIDYETLKTILK